MTGVSSYPSSIGDALSAGLTLRSSLYVDPEVHRVEQEQIFRRSWQYAGHVDWVREAGDRFICEIGGLPVVVVRDGEGSLNAFVNVCRHRFHEVASGRGNSPSLQCRYHGWTYSLDGSLRGAPRANRECDFDRRELSLIPVQVDAWGPLIFVNPDLEAAPLAETLGELPRVFAEGGGDLGGLEFRRRIEYPVSGNWKLFVENALECYHCPIAHPSFSKTFDVRPDVYKLEIHERFSCHRTRLRGHDESDAGPGFHFYFLWPNFFLSADRMQCEISYIRPVDATSSVAISDYHFRADLDDSAVEERIALTQTTLNEDLELIASVQRGTAAGAVPFGRLLGESEALVRHFDGLVAEALDRRDGAEALGL